MIETKRLSVLESYKDYKFKDDSKSKLWADKETYNKVIRTFNKNLFTKMKETGKEIKLYSRLGTLHFRKKKGSRKKIDINASKREGRTIYYKNYHSDGYTVRTHWSKLTSNVPNKRIWTFRLVRDRVKGKPDSLANYIKENGVKHFYEHARI